MWSFPSREALLIQRTASSIPELTKASPSQVRAQLSLHLFLQLADQSRQARPFGGVSFSLEFCAGWSEYKADHFQDPAAEGFCKGSLEKNVPFHRSLVPRVRW